MKLRIGNNYSETESTLILGPLLFLIFTNDVADDICSRWWVQGLFADDVILLVRPLKKKQYKWM